MGRTYRLEFPPGTLLLTANGRSSKNAISAGNRWKKREVTASLRDAGRKLAKTKKIPLLKAVHITALYYPPDRRRRDAPNLLFHSSKAVIDGFVDAGVLADDNDKIVRSLTLAPGLHIVKGGQMVIILEEVDNAA